MRDDRGRYISTKVIADNGPSWASGCPSCKFGIVKAELTGACEFYLERMVQALETRGAVFCTCRAGETARNHMRNLRLRRIEEARKIPLAREHGYDSSPEIEIAKQKIAAARAANVPTMRFEGERVPA
jgi:hypothetical protein